MTSTTSAITRYMVTRVTWLQGLHGYKGYMVARLQRQRCNDVTHVIMGRQCFGIDARQPTFSPGGGGRAAGALGPPVGTFCQDRARGGAGRSHAAQAFGRDPAASYV